jgi:hypothetical protein
MTVHILDANFMKFNFYRTSILTLFVISVLPILFLYAFPKAWPFANIIAFTFLSIWAYSIVKHLVTKNNYDETINFKSFRALLILVNIYVDLLSIYFTLKNSIIDDPKWMLLIIIVGQFFHFASSLYLLRFFAKIISTVEFKRQCHFSDYLVNMILLILFPIGIWWLHPKIQSLIKL